MDTDSQIICGNALDVLATLPSGSAHCCVTSPPYFGLRRYSNDCNEIGAEATYPEYIDNLVGVFREVRRVLRDDGTLWLVLGDCYATGAGKVGRCPGGGYQGATWAKKGPSTPANRLPQPKLKPKDLIGIPWRVAFALQDEGWYLRSDVVWQKRNPVPESIRDRPTRSHEFVFLLSKSKRYYYDYIAVREPATTIHNNGVRDSGGTINPNQGKRQPKFGGTKYPGAAGSATYSGNEYTPNGFRNRRDVWTVTTSRTREKHFATFPPDLIRPCIIAGCPPGGVVLDPFFGAGTTGLVAIQEGRRFIGIDLNPDYCRIAEERIAAARAQETAHV